MDSRARRPGRARRGAARVGVSVASLVLGAAVVTHGSARALAAFTPVELATVSCQSQHAAVSLAPGAVVLSGLGPECAGLPVRVDLTDALSARVTVVRGALQRVPGSTDLMVAVAPGAVPSQVQLTVVRLGG